MSKADWARGTKTAEIVGEMFEELGFSVHKYGVEHSVPSFTTLLKKRGKKRRNKIEKRIATMPDLVVDHEEKGTFLIEVKYRRNGQLKIPTGYQHEDTLFVVISKKFIQCITISEYEDGERINDDGFQHQFLLGNRDEFKFNTDEKAIISRYYKRSTEEVY